MRKLTFALILLLCSVPSFAVFNATMQWEVRTTGSDSNGGGFDPGVASPGTDYSQQDACQVSYTDLVIDGVTNTKVTSAAHPFDSTSRGNVINITAGTGFTVQRVEIISVSGSTATVDKSLGTLSSTGGIGCLGGGLLTLSSANTLLGNGMTINIKAGTYTLTSAITVTKGSLWWGYQTTHGDEGTKPLITTATNSVSIFISDTSGGTNPLYLRNLSLSSTATTRGNGIESRTHSEEVYLINSILDGFATGFDGDNASGNFDFTIAQLSNSEIKNCTSYAFRNGNSSGTSNIYASNIHDNTAQATYAVIRTSSKLTVLTTLITNNTGKGIFQDTAPTLLMADSTVANNSDSGINPASLGNPNVSIFNTIIYGNGGWGITGIPLSSSGFPNGDLRSVAFGANSFGSVGGLGSTGTNPITLTADPFTNDSGSNRDYSLNNTAGGGALLRGLGFPGIFPGGASTGYASPGAVQPSLTSSSGSAVQTTVQN